MYVSFMLMIWLCVSALFSLGQLYVCDYGCMLVVGFMLWLCFHQAGLMFMITVAC